MSPWPPSFRNRGETILFQSGMVTIGTFRCPPEHPQFRDSGPSNAYCFVFPRTTVWIQHAGEPPFLADPTVVTYLNEGQEYFRTGVAGDGDRAEWFAVVPEVAAEILGTVAPRSLGKGRRVFAGSHGRCDAATYMRQRRLTELLSQHVDVDPLHAEELVLSLLGRVASSSDGEAARRAAAASRRQRAFEADVRVLVASTISEKVHLSNLAAGLGCSVYSLCHRFKRIHGMSIHRYRQNLRLRLSLERLRDGERNLTSLALDLGFSSHSHFTAAFRRQFGRTPSAFVGELQVGSAFRHTWGG
jgi:AraC family transcriptional regulator